MVEKYLLEEELREEKNCLHKVRETLTFSSLIRGKEIV